MTTAATDREAAFDAWLSQTLDRERTPVYADWKLDPVRRVLAHLPAPPRPATFAGTKGKGSTLAFVDAILRAAGRRTVAFTSPHVRSLRERFLIDGEPAGWDELEAAAARVARAEGREGVSLSWFERAFAVACQLAAARPDHHFLCEVGLGGRLDCANALDARVVAISAIGVDHAEILGPTPAAIAREKLAVARPDAPLFIAEQRHRAAVAAAVPRGIRPRWIPALPPETHLRLGLAGAHQRANAALAIAVAEALLAEADPDADHHAAFGRGLAAARCPARCELLTLTDGRRCLLDSAHTPESIAAGRVAANAALRPGYRAILALAKDKDAEGALVALAGIPIHRCAYAWPRARERDDWPPGAERHPWHEHVRTALATIPADADLLITGSFYLAGEAAQALEATGLIAP